MKNQTCRIAFRVSLIFLVFSYFINPGLVNGQSFFFDNYSVKEGLAQSTVFDVLQDSHGYLWLGTAVGVSHFDGLRFKNYTYENGLANDAVQRIIEDKWGNIWFGHKGGAISRFKNDSIQFFRPDSISADITSLTIDSQGNIWIGSFGMGVIQITNPNAELMSELKFVKYSGTKYNISKVVFSIAEIEDGTILFISSEGLRYFDKKNNTFKEYKKEGLPEFYQFTCFFEDNSGNLWFGTDIGGLFKLSKNGQVVSFNMKNGLVGNFISSISQDKNNNIWVGTWGNGISTISNGKILNLDKSNGLPDLKIRCIKPDLEGNVLIGTNENGLCIFKSRRFINYSERDGIKGLQVNTLLKDSENRLWFGTDYGISVFERSGIFLINPIYFNQENGKLSENKIKFLKQDKTGNVWVATDHSVMCWVKATNNMEYNFLINGYLSQNNIVTAIEIDSQNNIWIGTVNGLIVYEIDTDKVSFLKAKDGLVGNDISALYSDTKGQVWIGCHQKGLTIYNSKEGTFTILKTEAELGFTPNCITESGGNTIWVGTQAEGLLVFNNLDLIKQFRMKDGLYSDFISALVTGKNGDIYIGTSRGLNIFRNDSKQFLRYSEKAGFTGIEVKKNASFTDENGNIWFGTVKGATRIDVSTDNENRNAPPIRINRLRVNMLDRKIQDGLVFNYGENSILIDYVGICLTDPQSVVYRIMLEGAEEDYQPETNQSVASFSNLAPGKYTFKVMAKNNSGIWSPEPATLTFEIKPPFYRSWFFYLIVIISTTALVIAFIKYREKALIMEKRVLAEKVADRTVEISIKNRELELKNKNITDSIKYAKRIQDALLPDKDYLRNVLMNYFVLYMPRDIISGDYYWATRIDNWIIVAVVDCTGHGVPGAFMSMLGITLLDEIVNKKKIVDANQILDELRESVINSLKQKGVRGETQDGMDIALCTINAKTLEMQFAGAYNPCYIVRNGEMFKLKADRMPIGIYYKKTKEFALQTFQLVENDVIYLFTDGYVDQFGFAKGEKFMNKNFKTLLLEIHQKPLDKQRKILEETLKTWKGNIDQVDDILVLGMRINMSNFKDQNIG
jgi:ligand-binding sensor domain-containing protein/serine phosphatase RsbU (regulator of sigma subunit)